MRLAMLLPVVGPVVGALALTALNSPSRAMARAASLSGAVTGLGGACYLLARTAGGATFAERGFEADAWRAALALAILGVGAACLSSRDGSARERAAALAGLAAGAASVLASEIVSAAGFLVVTTAALGAIAWERGERAPARVFLVSVVGDVAAVTGLLLVAGHGLRVPPAPSGVGAGLLAAAALVRLGLLDQGARADASGGGAARAVLLGAHRTQGFALAAWVAAGSDSAGTGLAIAAALLALPAARRAARDGSAGSALAAAAALVAVGLGLGSAGGIWAAALLAAGTTAAAAAGSSPEAFPSIGAAPLGATLAGAALVAVGALDRALVDRPFLVVAGPACLVLVWLAQAGAAGFAGGRAHPVPTRVAAAVAIAGLTFAPVEALRQIGPRVAASLGVAPALQAPRQEIPAALAFAFALGAVAAIVGTLVARTRPAASPPAEPDGDAPVIGEPAAAARLLVIGIVSLAAAAGVVIALLRVGVQRGFL